MTAHPEIYKLLDVHNLTSKAIAERDRRLPALEQQIADTRDRHRQHLDAMARDKILSAVAEDREKGRLPMDPPVTRLSKAALVDTVTDMYVRLSESATTLTELDSRAVRDRTIATRVNRILEHANEQLAGVTGDTGLRPADIPGYLQDQSKDVALTAEVAIYANDIATAVREDADIYEVTLRYTEQALSRLFVLGAASHEAHRRRDGAIIFLNQIALARNIPGGGPELVKQIGLDRMLDERLT